MDGLADCADLVRWAGPRPGHITRYNDQAVAVEVAAAQLLTLISNLLEDTDDWLAHDPKRGADDFERLAFGARQESIFEQMKAAAVEVAAKADELRGLL